MSSDCEDGEAEALRVLSRRAARVRLLVSGSLMVLGVGIGVLLALALREALLAAWHDRLQWDLLDLTAWVLGLTPPVLAAHRLARVARRAVIRHCMVSWLAEIGQRFDLTAEQARRLGDLVE